MQYKVKIGFLDREGIITKDMNGKNGTSSRFRLNSN